MVRSRRFRDAEAGSWADLAGLAAVVCRPDGRLSQVSAEAAQLLGRGGKAPRRWQDTLLAPMDVGQVAALARQLRQGRRLNDSQAVIAVNGRRLQMRLSLLAGGDVLILFTDITRQLALAEGMGRLQSENAAWAAEVQHRVRNTLHVLSAMMRLEAAAKSPDQVLERVHGRILAMAQAHDGLDMRSGVALVDLASCIRALHALAQESTQPPDGASLQLCATDDDVAVPVDVAVPIALIMHEVFSAAEADKAVAVKLSRQGENTVLSVDSAGLDQVDLGYIETLARQLRARFFTSQGRRLQLEFPPLAA